MVNYLGQNNYRAEASHHAAVNIVGRQAVSEWFKLLNSRVLLVTALLVAALLAGIAPIPAFPQKASASIFATNSKLNGGSRTGWLPFSSGGLHISANSYMGSNTQGLAGEKPAISPASTGFRKLPSRPPSLAMPWGTAPSVRVQNGGRNFFVWIYVLNDGNPYLQIFRKTRRQLVGPQRCLLLSRKPRAGTKAQPGGCGLHHYPS